ncbi:hypothetical protein BMS3Abin04_00018 [bacterium BMS3Abin04]|nr:hypothetical protein BMS3Abin04_00018 [bacterium BMS3Abin04]
MVTQATPFKTVMMVYSLEDKATKWSSWTTEKRKVKTLKAPTTYKNAKTTIESPIIFAVAI